jgi:hypothetical protein
MKSSILSALAVATSVGITSSVLAQTPLPTQNSFIYQNFSDSVYLTAWANGGGIYISGSSYDTPNGTPSGYIYITYYGPYNPNGTSDYLSIHCYGPVVSKLISVNPSGSSTLKGTVSSTTPGCGAYSYGNIPQQTPITFDFSGKSNNSYNSVSDAISRYDSYGTTFIRKEKYYNFVQDYSGTVSVYPNLTFSVNGSGYANATRVIAINKQ